MKRFSSSQTETKTSFNAADDSGPLTPIFTSFQSADSRVVLREALSIPEHESFGDGQHRSPHFRRAVKDEGSGLGDSAETVKTCDYPNETVVEPFSPIVAVLNDARIECEFDSMPEGNSSYTLISDFVRVQLSADDDSVLLVDHFHLNRTYALEVRSICEHWLCEDFIIFLNVTILDYSRRLLPYGPILEDAALQGVDDDFTTLTALQPIPIFDSHYSNIYVSHDNHA